MRINNNNNTLNHKIAVVDLETTGFLKEGGLIVEVGIAQLDLHTGKIESLYDKLVKEDSFNDAHKDSWIFKNSDLKFEDILKADELDVEGLQNIFDKYSVTAYNKRFDIDYMLDRGLKVKELPCPMHLMTPICKIPGKYGNYKWPSVQESYEFLFGEEEFKEAHRGLDDAMHEAKIVHWLYKEGHFKI